MSKTDLSSKVENQPFGLIDKLISSSSKDAKLIEAKHQKIIEGACSVLFEKGYHMTTIRDIAKACHMSMGQLYHYISSKDDVLYLVHKHMQKVWYEYLERSHLEKIEDPLQKFKEALYRSLKFMIENKKLIQFIYSESKYLDKKHLQVVLELDEKNVIGFWQNLLREIHKSKPLKGDPDFLGNLIAFILVFLSLRSWTLRGKPQKKIIDSLLDFILRGLGLI